MLVIKDIYILECEGFYKIGIAKNVKSRHSSIQTSCPFPVKIIKIYHNIFNTEDVERKIHQELWKYNVSGEWFKCDLQEIFFVIERNIRYDIMENFEQFNENIKNKNNGLPIIEFKEVLIQSLNNMFYNGIEIKFEYKYKYNNKVMFHFYFPEYKIVVNFGKVSIPIMKFFERNFRYKLILVSPYEDLNKSIDQIIEAICDEIRLKNII